MMRKHTIDPTYTFSLAAGLKLRSAPGHPTWQYSARPAGDARRRSGFFEPHPWELTPDGHGAQYLFDEVVQRCAADLDAPSLLS